MQTESAPPMASTTSPASITANTATATAPQDRPGYRPYIQIKPRSLRDSRGKSIADREVWVDGELRGIWKQQSTNGYLHLHLLNGDWAYALVASRSSISGYTLSPPVKAYIHNLVCSTYEAIEQGALPSPADQRAQNAAATARRDAEYEASRRFAITRKHLPLIQEAIIEAIDTLEVIDGGKGNADAVIAKLYRAKAAALGVEPDAEPTPAAITPEKDGAA